MEVDPLWGEALGWLDRRLASHLAMLRNRSKTPFADTVSGGFVSDDEAELLIGALSADHGAVRREQTHENECMPLPATLSHLVGTFHLDRFETHVVLLALAAEIDTRYARLFAFLNDHAAHQRPTVGLAIATYYVSGAWGIDRLAAFAAGGRLLRFALIELDGEGPFGMQSIRLPAAVWLRLVDASLPPPIGTVTTDGVPLAELILDADTRARAVSIVTAIQRRTCSTVLVHGPDGSGREAIASAFARELSRPTFVAPAGVDPRVVSRESRWYGAVPIVRDQVPRVDPLDVPVIMIAADSSHEELRAERADLLELALKRPSIAMCREIWRRFIRPEHGDPSPPDLEQVAARFPMSPRRIAAVAARQRASGRISTADLLEACREFPDARFDGLAERLTTRCDWDDLVIPAETRRELELVLAWARGGRFALEDLGIHGPAGRGLACLFHGPPGTGKTMGAQVLARALGVELVRIDLSQVVNKYIGETEKNLARVFDAARESNALVFFDEADALFAKRTMVKDSNDRFANLETGFLLQRLESHEGVTILATNLRSNLDEAFLRRLHVIAEFPLPEAPDRRRIWKRTLPRRHTDDIDLDLLAGRFKLSGGNIRNAVMTAVLFATQEARDVSMRDLVRALLRELRRTGRIVNTEDFGSWKGEVQRSLSPPPSA